MIILYGIKHCGKSTVGSLLAKKLNVLFVDLDSVIEQIAQKSCRELYIQDGKEAFLQTEVLAARQIVENSEFRNAIIASGGGICDNSQALEILSNQNYQNNTDCQNNQNEHFFIQIDEDIAFERIKQSSIEKGSWPAWIPANLYKDGLCSNIEAVKSIFHSFYEERTQKYAKLCKNCVAVENGDSTVAVDKILKIHNNMSC